MRGAMPTTGTDPTAWNHASPVLEVSDVQRSIAFYRDVLGLVPSWMWEDRIGGVTTQHGRPARVSARTPFTDASAAGHDTLESKLGK